jgi:iron complex transport system substrate-binding protein
MRRYLWFIVAGFVLVVAACGSGEAADTTSATVPPTEVTAAPATTLVSTYPLTVSSDAGEITLDAQPMRIAALSATHVEMLYAIDAGDQIVAGDDFSNYPDAAEALDKVDSFNLSVEAVIALDPDLVILTFDPVDAVPALEAVGIPTLLFATATSLDDAYEQMAILGTATGHDAEATELIASIQAEIASIVDAAGDAGNGVTYYHETDPFSFYTPNSSSFIGQIYRLFGMENIADAAPDEFASGFPQLSPEFIIDTDPKMIFLAAFGESPETLAARAGWESMTAIAEGNVTVIDADIASRWGPRVVDMVRVVADALGSP